VFLDVDGPLIPFGGVAVHHGPPPGPGEHPLLDRLDPALGARLLALPGRLVWATTWGRLAEEVVAPRIGLPALPAVTWPDEPATSPGCHWKTAGLVAWADGRPFVWLDDEITAADHRWVAAHHPGRALLHRVDPRTGLTAADLATVTGWLRAGESVGADR